MSLRTKRRMPVKRGRSLAISDRKKPRLLLMIALTWKRANQCRARKPNLVKKTRLELQRNALAKSGLKLS